MKWPAGATPSNDPSADSGVVGINVRTYALVAALVSIAESAVILTAYRYWHPAIAPPWFILWFLALHAVAGALLGWLIGNLEHRAPPRRRLVPGFLLASGASLAYLLPHWHAVFRQQPLQGKALAALAALAAPALAAALLAATLRTRQRLPGALATAATVASVLAASLLLPRLEVKTEPPASRAIRSQATRPETIRSETVVILTFDALRADHLSSYGYPRDTGRHLDRVLAGGLRFETALAPKTKTGPSLASLLTGLYPPRHGSMRHGWALSEGIETLAELVPARYQTAAFVANPVMHSVVEKAGFDHYELLDRAPAPQVTGAAARWLRRQAGRPVLLWVHLFEPHSPYAAPGEDWTHYRSDDLYDVGAGTPYDWRAAAAKVAVAPGKGRRAVEAGVNEMAARYDGYIRYGTRHAAGFLEQVFQLRQDPFVLVTADHGESMVEHDFFFWHGRYCYQPVVAVPFILHHPSLGLTGTSDMPVSLVDVAPTVCGLVDCREHAPLDGVDVIAALREEPPPRALYTSGRDHPLYSSWAVVDGGWKLIATPRRLSMLVDGIAHSRARLMANALPETMSVNPYRFRLYDHELYDLRQDPGELQNLADSEPLRREQLSRQLMAWLDEQYHAASITGVSRTQEIDEPTREKLRALGYVD